jgi:hypothetical protein
MMNERGDLTSVAAAAAVFGEVDLRRPRVVRRPQEGSERDAQARVDPHANLVLTVGLLQPGPARDSARHPPPAELGVGIGLEVEHAIADDHV